MTSLEVKTTYSNSLPIFIIFFILISIAQTSLASPFHLSYLLISAELARTGLLCATSSNICTTALMVGLIAGSLAVQMTPICNTFVASSLLQGSEICESTRLDTLSPLLIALKTHPTMSLFSPNSSSTGLFPVASSINTTPKLYTSVFSVTLHVYPYSASNVQTTFSSS